MNWWLSTGDKTEGPFPEEHVVEWFKSGQIRPDTMACPVGSQEWKKLNEIADFVRLAPPPPPRPHSTAAKAHAATVPGSDVRTRFGILYAAIALAGVSLLFELLLIGDTGEELSAALLIGLCIAVGDLITWAVFHYGLWQLLPEEYRETTPGKAVGFLFIPFYNCYWVFCSYMGVNRGLNRLADAHRLPPPRANVGLATAAAVFFVVATFFILMSLGLPTVEGIENQYVIRDQYDLENAYNDVVATHAGFAVISLFVSSIPGFVLWLLMVLNQKRMVEHLLANDVPVSKASGLLEHRA